MELGSQAHGLLTPHWVCEPSISPAHKQVVAVVGGGMAGAVCFVGLSMLLLSDWAQRIVTFRSIADGLVALD